MHYLDKEKVTRQPVRDTPVHPDGGGMRGSEGTGCRDERVQMWASWGDSWLSWYSVRGAGLLRCLSRGCWVVEMLQLMN